MYSPNLLVVSFLCFIFQNWKTMACRIFWILWNTPLHADFCVSGCLFCWKWIGPGILFVLLVILREAYVKKTTIIKGNIHFDDSSWLILIEELACITCMKCKLKVVYITFATKCERRYDEYSFSAVYVLLFTCYQILMQL